MADLSTINKLFGNLCHVVNYYPFCLPLNMKGGSYWWIKHPYFVGMSSIWRGSIHSEINDFDVKSICQYAQSMCGGLYMFAKHTFLSGKKLPQKHVNGIICVYFDQLNSQISPQSKISIANVNKTRCLLSGIHLGDNFRHA